MIRSLIINIVLNAGALYGVLYLMPSISYTGGLTFFAIGGLVMGVLNSVVKPVLKILTFPIHIITIGFSLILLNGVIFWLFDQSLQILALEGITLTVPTFRTYFLAGFLFGLINWVEHLIIRK
ncbi:hypothetical protein CO046_01865 [Candidatus Peregrinibacteria bacterium CG_4_9_14_0_2_um_filter_53_11]|nr:MAG: hypothetical protein CO046_01865 [Candidatus Peregrinibacteria bacterium CG_4_9_14_0_2_um_filter_53_11]